MLASVPQGGPHGAPLCVIATHGRVASWSASSAAGCGGTGSRPDVSATLLCGRVIDESGMPLKRKCADQLLAGADGHVFTGTMCIVIAGRGTHSIPASGACCSTSQGRRGRFMQVCVNHLAGPYTVFWMDRFDAVSAGLC